MGQEIEHFKRKLLFHMICDLHCGILILSVGLKT